MKSTRLAEIIGALSIASDLGAGMPAETSLRSTVLAVRIGKMLSLTEKELSGIYYACLLRFIGCSATSVERAAAIKGQDAKVIYAIIMSDWTQPADVEKSLQRVFNNTLSTTIISKIQNTVHHIEHINKLHCKQARILAAKLSLPCDTISLLNYIYYHRWDGKLLDIGGKEIPLAARIISVAVAAETFHRLGGITTVLDMLINRSGTTLDPALCKLLQQNISTLLDGDWQTSTSHWQIYLDSEPDEPVHIEQDQLGNLAEAFADYTDQKCGWFLGHSHQVAKLATTAASEAGYSKTECEYVRLAALFHDIGRVAVANAIWDKPESLTHVERLRAESHSFHTEMILAMVPNLKSIACIAASTHERADGSGYHHKSAFADPLSSILATADIYNALTHPRPWREALSNSLAADELLSESKAARLPAASVDAVLVASGSTGIKASAINPGGLTAREVEVLIEIARGLSTKAIAKALDISPKTADHHIQKIYEKTGTRSRAAAALYALEHKIFSQ